MRILIVSGIVPPEVGGPALYAQELVAAFQRQGHETALASFGWKKKLPTGLRHLALILTLVPRCARADVILALDTFSVAWPSVVAAKLCRRPVIVRAGGDFLWEQYLERVRQPITLPDFYQGALTIPLNLKERLIKRITLWTLRQAAAVVFNSRWLLEIWRKPYGLEGRRLAVVDNYFQQEAMTSPGGNNILFVGRKLYLKNEELVDRLTEQLQVKQPELTLCKMSGPREQFLKQLKNAYAILIPSWSEVNPNTAADALSYGKPCLLTKYTGLPDVLKSGTVLVDPYDEASVLESIIRLADKSNYEAACRKVRSISYSHGWDDIACEYLGVIDSVL